MGECKTCPLRQFCEKVYEKADHTECICRIAEYSLMLLGKAQLHRLAVELRRLNNLLLSAKYWCEEELELWGGLANLFIPGSILATWGGIPHATLIGHVGGCSLFVEGGLSLLAQPDLARACAALHNILETPASVPEPVECALGIATGVGELCAPSS